MEKADIVAKVEVAANSSQNNVVAAMDNFITPMVE